MSKETEADSTADRRHFLKLIGVAGAAVGALPLGGATAAADTAVHGHAIPAPVAAVSRPARYRLRILQHQ